jgi:hypothetical protein
MKRRVRQAFAWFRKDTTQRAIQLALVGLGANALNTLLKDTEKRLSALEDGGLVPLDDVVTLRDHSKLESRLERVEAVVPIAPPPPMIDAEVVEEVPGAVGASVGPEGAQEDQEGS